MVYLNGTHGIPRNASDLTAANQMTTMEAALYYAEQGLRVIPVYEPRREGGCVCGKAECSSPGKHPRVWHWVQAASVDPGEIRHWWEEWPNANVGIATGRDSGVWVLDIDLKEDALSLAAIEAEYGPFPGAPRVTTGSGGTHIYFGLPAAEVPCRVDILPGVDVRGVGGYVVAPPSLHVCGKVYSWEGA
jgi:hypothetical protein